MLGTSPQWQPPKHVLGAVSEQPAGRGRFLRIGEVIRETGVSRTTIYRLELKGDFPNRVRISGNSIGWWSADIDQWVAARRHPEPG